MCITSLDKSQSQPSSTSVGDETFIQACNRHLIGRVSSLFLASILSLVFTLQMTKLTFKSVAVILTFNQLEKNKNGLQTISKTGLKVDAVAAFAAIYQLKCALRNTVMAPDRKPFEENMPMAKFLSRIKNLLWIDATSQRWRSYKGPNASKYRLFDEFRGFHAECAD